MIARLVTDGSAWFPAGRGRIGPYRPPPRAGPSAIDLVGPYGSDLVRQVGPIVSQQGAVLWTHGGAADDLMRPLLVPVSAPASTCFRGAAEMAHRKGLGRVVLAQGRGRFTSTVISGAHQRAAELDLRQMGHRRV